MSTNLNTFTPSFATPYLHKRDFECVFAARIWKATRHLVRAAASYRSPDVQYGPAFMTPQDMRERIAALSKTQRDITAAGYRHQHTEGRTCRDCRLIIDTGVINRCLDVASAIASANATSDPHDAELRPYTEKVVIRTRGCFAALQPVPEIGRVSASAVRRAEAAAFRTLQLIVPATQKHIAGCESCQHHRDTLKKAWADCNLWLQAKGVPTLRAMSREDFLQAVEQRKYERLRRTVTSLLAAQTKESNGIQT